MGVEMLKADWRELGRLARSYGMVWVRSDGGAALKGASVQRGRTDSGAVMVIE